MPSKTFKKPILTAKFFYRKKLRAPSNTKSNKNIVFPSNTYYNKLDYLVLLPSYHKWPELLREKDSTAVPLFCSSWQIYHLAKHPPDSHDADFVK